MNDSGAEPPGDEATALRASGSSTLGGVLDELGLDGLITGLKPITPGLRLAGPAFTVKAIAAERGTFDPAAFDIAAYVDAAPPGAVIAIDLGGKPVSTLGGIAALVAQKRGVEGIVVDGGVRDADEIAELRFPVFSRHTVPVSGRTRVSVIATEVAVTVDGVLVRPGDYLVGDRTGLVRLPGTRVAEILERAWAVQRRDERARAAVCEGASFAEAFARARAGTSGATG